MTLIKSRLHEDVITIPGKLGQFEIMVDAKTIAQRGGGIFTQLMGGGYPDLDHIVEELKKYRELNK